MVKRFLSSARPGFYLAVTREGAVAANDEIVLIDREPNSVPVSEITRLYVAKTYSTADLASAARTLSIAALPESWKDHFREQLQRFKP
jgi:MOSC domain-containing protein YiiM